MGVVLKATFVIAATAAVPAFVAWSTPPVDAPAAERSAIAENPNLDCSTVKCMGCPEGYTRKDAANSCCGQCVKDGGAKKANKCKSASDCEGLLHLACVGSWACEKSACVYTCDTTP